MRHDLSLDRINFALTMINQQVMKKNNKNLFAEKFKSFNFVVSIKHNNDE
jgi:hypothetical protein